MKPRLVQPLGPWPEQRKPMTPEERREADRLKAARYLAKNREARAAACRAYKLRRKQEEAA